MATIYSSSDYNDGKISAQGNYEARIENNIFISTVTGPLNTEGIIALGKVRHACLSELNGRDTIAAIVTYRNSMMMSPQALAIYTKSLQQDLTETKADYVIAYVVPDHIEGRAIMLPILEAIFLKANLTWQSFEKIADAETWINAAIKAT